MTHGARRTDHFSSPTACSSNAVLQSLHQWRFHHRCLATRPSRPGRGWHLQVAQIQLLVGVLVHPLQCLECSCWRLRVVQVLVQVHHLWRSGSPPALQERPKFQPSVSLHGRWWPSLHLEPSSRQSFSRSESASTLP